MKKSDQLKQLRASKIEAQKAIHATADGEQRNLNADETTQFRALQTEIEDLDGQIRDALAFENNVRTLEGSQQVYNPGNNRGTNGEDAELGKLKKRFSLHKVMSALHENRSVDGAEKELTDEYKKRALASGIAISGFAIPIGETRADGQTVTEDSGAYGGNLVQTDVQAPIEYLRPKLVLEQLGARVITGLTGNLKFPTNDGGISAAWEGEVDAATATKTAIGSKTMQPNRLAAKVLVSIQNLMQSGAIEMMTIEDINAVIAQKLTDAAINGNGGNISGILNTSGVGSVAGGTNGLAPTWDNMVALESKIMIANAEGANMAYLINAKTRGKLKTTPKISGYPQFIMADDGSVNGYRTATTNLVPSNLTKGTASDVCSAAVFGDFSQLVIGQWAYADLTVDRITQAEEGYVKYIINTFNDVMVRQVGAFSHIKDLLTA